jgi:pilus assembly protein CpaB
MRAARIVVLIVAVGAGGVAALLAGRTQKSQPVQQAAPKVETVDILVAKSDIAMGKSIAPGDLQWQAWPANTASGNFIRKKDQPAALDKLGGQIARAPFVAGEPIREAKLVDAKGSGFMAAILPSGMRAVSTQISPETGAGGFILPNDHVDVILTKRNAGRATSDDQASDTVLRNIRVLAIDQTVQEKDGQKVVVGKTATLALTPQQAETLTSAQHLGALSLTLRSIVDASQETTKPDSETSKKRAVNVVRFGVATPTAAQ